MRKAYPLSPEPHTAAPGHRLGTACGQLVLKRSGIVRYTISMSISLTPKQKRVLDAVTALWRTYGYAPSIREVASQLRLAPSTTHEHVRALEKRRVLRNDGSTRGIELIQDVVSPAEAMKIPLMGTIAAGEPIEAIEDRGEPLILPRSVATPGTFALRVKGDSMIDDHILDGDFVVVSPHASVKNGDVAVVLLDEDCVTLKRVFREANRVRLQPANAKLKPTYTRNLRIQGKVTAIFRESLL